jgi:TolB-like protein/Flp pilus assembly protein TadD
MNRTYALGEFLLEPEKCLLSHDGKPTHLAQRPFQVLLYLIQNRDRVISKNELLDKFWDGHDVYEVALSKCIGTIRKALGDRLDQPRFIETRWAGGYRYIGPLEDKAELNPAVSAGVVSAATSDEKDSIAVLPFLNLSADPENEYFCDGLAEELICSLAKIDGLKVAARTSAFSFKGKDANATEIGSALGVRTVVEGSVRKSGNKIRISVQLISAPDGYHLWSEQYDRELHDVFEVQNDISKQITANLKLQLIPDEKRAQNAEAYLAYLKGRYFWNKRTEEDTYRGIEYLEDALSHDPDFPLAYTGLADCHTLLGDVGVQAVHPKSAFEKAQKYCIRALELDHTLGEAHSTLGHISMHLYDWTLAEQEFVLARDLSSNYSPAWLYHAYFMAFTGHPAESLDSIERAIQVDPLSMPVNRSAAELYHFAGRHNEAIDRFRKSIEMESHYLGFLELGRVYEHLEMYDDAIAQFLKAREVANDSPDSLASLAHCYGVSGAHAEAQKLLRELTRRAETEYVSPYVTSLVHKSLGEKKKCFEFLDRAREIHDGWIIYIAVDPRWYCVRTDPDFVRIVSAIGLNLQRHDRRI